MIRSPYSNEPTTSADSNDNAVCETTALLTVDEAAVELGFPPAAGLLVLVAAPPGAAAPAVVAAPAAGVSVTTAGVKLLTVRLMPEYDVLLRADVRKVLKLEIAGGVIDAGTTPLGTVIV
mmetsp:Transcript_13289/g.26090  ORF Transcript_13289/g.26090 Transcript_13289/m.26090 type:complete len:120 (-) Transcript_13289:64-423(-)